MDELKEELDLASDPLLGAAREREYQPITVPLRGSYNTSRVSRFPQNGELALNSSERVQMRTTVISALSIGLLLIIILHLPPSQLSKQLSDHFHYLNPGYFNPDLASSAPNPLPSSAFFSDIPFAKVDTGDLKEGEEVPAWATKEGSGGYSLEEELGRMKRGGRSWNGTHAWEKTVLIISLECVVRRSVFFHSLTCCIATAAYERTISNDISLRIFSKSLEKVRLRTNFLQTLFPTLTLKSLAGLRAKFLRPVFPTLTFPNHYSLMYVPSPSLTPNRIDRIGSIVLDYTLPRMELSRMISSTSS